MNLDLSAAGNIRDAAGDWKRAVAMLEKCTNKSSVVQVAAVLAGEQIQ